MQRGKKRLNSAGNAVSGQTSFKLHVFLNFFEQITTKWLLDGAIDQVAICHRLLGQTTDGSKQWKILRQFIMTFMEYWENTSTYVPHLELWRYRPFVPQVSAYASRPIEVSVKVLV